MLGGAVGFGVLGLGAIGPTHCEAIQAVAEANLLAVCDKSPSRAAIGQRYSVSSYTDITEFLAHPGLEAVNICVPSGYHAEVGRLVARSGKHVLVEKPIEVTLEAADQLISDCKASGVKLGVISQHRFAPDVLKLKTAIEAGELGALVLGEASIKWYRSQEYYDSGSWRGTWELDGGGALINQGVHYIDLLQWLMGQVAEVKAFVTTAAHNIAVEDLAVAVLRFKNGAMGRITGSTAIYPGLPEKLEIHGRDGTAIIEADKLTGYYLRQQLGDPGLYGFSASRLKELQAINEFAITTDNKGPGGIGSTTHAEQVADFARAIRTGASPAITGEDGRRSLAIIKAIYQSAQENQTVFLR